jgi:hypothetical protein
VCGLGNDYPWGITIVNTPQVHFAKIVGTALASATKKPRLAGLGFAGWGG